MTHPWVAVGLRSAILSLLVAGSARLGLRPWRRERPSMGDVKAAEARMLLSCWPVSDRVFRVGQAASGESNP